MNTIDDLADKARNAADKSVQSGDILSDDVLSESLKNFYEQIELHNFLIDLDRQLRDIGELE